MTWQAGAKDGCEPPLGGCRKGTLVEDTAGADALGDEDWWCLDPGRLGSSP